MVKNSWLKNTFGWITHWFIQALCIIFFISFSYFFIRYYIGKSLVVSHAELNLTDIANQREQEILTTLSKQEQRVAVLAHNDELIASFDQLNNLNLNGASDDYKNEVLRFEEIFNKNQGALNNTGLLCINEKGIVFYASQPHLIGKNIFDSLYSNSVVKGSFERVRITFTPDVSEFAIDTLFGGPSLFIVQQIVHKGLFKGALAVRLNEVDFYKIIQKYSELGTAGDIFVTKNIGERDLFIAPSRLYPDVAFKKIINSDKQGHTPAHKASLGLTGHGIAIDSFGIKVVASWKFIPQVDWGIAVGKQFEELIQPLRIFYFLYVLFLLLFIVCIIFLVFRLRHSLLVKQFSLFLFSSRIITIFLWIFFGMSVAVSLLFVWKRNQVYHSRFIKAQELAQSKVHTEVEFINQSVIAVEKIAKAIAHDLQVGFLRKEDIEIRIGRDLLEFPDIARITVAYAPFAYDPEQRLYAVEAKRMNDAIQTSLITDDYLVTGVKQGLQSDWYAKALKQGAFWSEPYYDPISKKQEVLYALPFYKDAVNKEYTGVIAIIYQLDKVLSRARAIEIGKTGYSIILSQVGTLIYHPLEEYIIKRENLLDIAREQNNQTLIDFSDKIIKEDKGLVSYYNPHTKLDYWAVFETVPSNRWTVAALFSKDSLDLPIDQLHKQSIWILISIVIACLFLGMIISRFPISNFSVLTNWAIITAFILVSGLLIFWWMIIKNPYESSADHIVIRDQSSLDKYIEFLDLDAIQRNEKRPIVVPTGIILYSLSFPDSNKIAISGYVWQKINKNDHVVEGVRFPEASEVKLKEVLRKQDNDSEIIGWNVNASFLQKHRYSWFPFDRVHVDIIIASDDFEKNVILAPYFSGYRPLDIDPLPGITNKIGIPGFTLEKSFFSMTTVPPYDEVGLERLREVTEKVRLHYNVILRRNLTNPFIIFFLPLLIILFSIYAVFLVTFRIHADYNVFASLGAYTGIFFSLVLVHQTLRSQYQAGELLYIEYFFFFAYVTTLLLILHSLLLQVSNFRNFIDRRISPYLWIIFWPLQFGLWFLITMIVFYSLR